ncbi:hypothetical protein C0993_009307 [Termitomyces sp. T159_Od127]|nr:hypothetical protein C0993_009307 [Termitomyces sp. T159_Od127]
MSRRLQHVTEKLADKSQQALKQYQATIPSIFIGPQMPTISAQGPNITSDTTGTFEIPDSFRAAHPVLLQCLERQRQRQMQQPRSPELTRAPALPVYQGQQYQRQEAWLPDIYRYANAGVGKELRYPFQFPGQGQVKPETSWTPVPASAQAKTPFVPGMPRVDANTEFNFDHGELVKQCEETGYMAWF